MPERIGKAVRLDGLIALEIKQRLDGAVAGRVALQRRSEISARFGADLGPEVERFAKRLPDQVGGEVAVVEPLGQPMRQRVLEAVVGKDGRGDQRAERRLVDDDGAGIFDDRVPHRIDRLQVAQILGRILEIAAHADLHRGIAI